MKQEKKESMKSLTTKTKELKNSRYFLISLSLHLLIFPSLCQGIFWYQNNYWSLLQLFLEIFLETPNRAKIQYSTSCESNSLTFEHSHDACKKFNTIPLVME